MRRSWLVNTAITVAICVFVVAVTTFISKWNGPRFSDPDGPIGRPQGPLDALGYLWLAGTSAMLVLRTRFPLVTFVVTAALTISYFFWTAYPFGPLPVVPTIALITLSYLRGPLVASAAGLSIIVVAQVVEWQLDGRLLGLLLWLAAGTAIGNAIWARRERSTERSKRTAEEERLHLAREVHDVVAHSLAMINVQAGVGAHIADKRPDQAKEALLAIKEASRLALSDLRATLGVVRSGDRSPVPGLDRLPELLDATTAAGLTVEVRGEPGELPAPVGFSAYRILQESLTNAVRHARGADAVAIEFVRTETALDLVVTDNGSAPAGPAGNGIRGMRERAEALGGTLTAGPAERGFQVRAVLPLWGES
ncbi:MAG: histidine kinase [Kibdelosporangium sp.]